MVARRLLGVCLLTILVVACADQPTAIPAPKLQFVPWASGAAPQFTATTSVTNPGERDARLASALSLDQYAVSFWAVRGAARSVRINYRSAGDTGSHPFLEFTVTDPAWVPESGELAVGDSVLITVTVDTANLGVLLAPTGLRFGTPADLQIWYNGAGGDLNGDAVVDSTDAYIEQELLSIAYREGDSPWELISATHSLEDKSFTVALPHFSQYVLSFLDWVVSW